MKKLGWLISQNDFSKYTKKNNDTELNTVILELLADYMTGQQINLLNKALDLVKGLGDEDNRLIVFKQNTQTMDRGNFQLGVGGGKQWKYISAWIRICPYSGKKITKILFLNFKKDRINMKFNFYKASLVQTEFNKYRSLVKNKLGDSSSYIASLDI